MPELPNKRRRLRTGGVYRDRIPLENDFEVVKARTASRSGPNNLLVETDRTSFAPSWLVGTSWAPEDNLEFSLDPDHEWYDEVLEADVVEALKLDDTAPFANKKKRSHVSRVEGILYGKLYVPIVFPEDPRSLPMQYFDRWDGKQFIRTTLKDIGLVIHLNHASLKCPTPVPCDSRLRVLHTTGIHEIALSYCGCHREIPKDLQLLRRGLYPSSQKNVRTCVTFPLLKLLHLLSLIGKVSTYDMYRSLERITNNTGHGILICLLILFIVQISTCVGFQALAKATTQNTQGLRYTGVCGVMCGRSEMVLPNSIGNLQKGERYANMDYMFASAIHSTELLLVAISYDIVCQWFINIFNRMLAWPKELHPRAGLSLRPLIPKFHEPAHLEKGHEQYSFNLAEGMGLSDGECPERVWGSHNPLAGSTRTAGPGTRDDILDDNFGHWNWLKYTSIGENKQLEAHRGFSASLPSGLVCSWDVMCSAWDADGFPKVAPNPFKVTESDVSEADVEAALGKEEAAVSRSKGRSPLHTTSATSFLAMGMELEESHVRLVYMPGVLQIQTDLGQNPTAVWHSNPNPEDVELWLPSRLSPTQRGAACMEGLSEMEAKFRTAQCDSSLEGLRQSLRVKTRMVYFKNKNVRGQREGTRSRAIIDRVHKRAIRFVQKYRAARKAKFNLEGPGDWERMYRKLRNEDVRGFASGKKKTLPNRRAMDIFDEGTDSEESDPDLNDGTEAGPVRTKKKRKNGTGETRKELSWIWQTIRISNDEESQDDDILRAEWSRSRAQVRRCTEEVKLLREEMRRVLAFLKWEANQWEMKAEGREDLGMELEEGLRVYAAEQAAFRISLSSSFEIMFNTPLADVDKLLDDIDVNDESESESEGVEDNKPDIVDSDM
ncbi:hypothetical protein HYPSUDRAFT_151472 [Hypholoma sublateritium FD-334 SS-4]|uniref:CxC2-like cysteine cluster KDZ transposase-associated domain-containing protein n=1 Tax=Hypholoma sublateritium (strain FD-334 SS-4) TaxID=945553 RepID=A0A0D2NAC6_HYPSF|nr:hypothetical protein HYPSUDRAFT_151472 [Hypholoma sublateritium FD-334 SS-4]